MNAVAEPSQKVNLAQEPGFRLGVLHIHPSACRVGERRVEPRVMEVLVVLARARGETVTRDELIEACWGGRIVSDDAVTRTIAQVRGLARGLDPPPFVLETIPKVGFRLVAAEAEVPSTGPRIVRRRLALAATAVALLVAATLGWAIWRVAAPAQNGRVEVVLFEPLQADPVLSRFSVTLGDAVVRRLAGNGIKTAQRPVRRGDGTSSAELRVAGTIDREGDKYVVNAQVLDRRSGDVLWSARLDRKVASAPGFQEEVANGIGDTLWCALSSRGASNRPVSSTVFGLFLNACAIRRDDGARFLDITRRLVAEAPDLSTAHSFHALAQGMMVLEGLGGPAEIEAFRRGARASAARALELDPRNGEAYAAIGASYGSGGHWAEREAAYRKAAELGPERPRLQNLLSGTLREAGRFNDAMGASRRAVAGDTFSPTQLAYLAYLHALAGRRAEASAALDQLDLIRPEMGREARRDVAFWWDTPQAALAFLRHQAADPGDSDRPCLEDYLTRLVGGRGVRGLPASCGEVSAHWRVRMLGREGDLDGAYAEVARVGLPAGTYLFYPEMKAFRQDPRFVPLAKRLGLLDYWQRSGHWPDFCSEPDLPYDCRKAAAAL
jgi:TolB-like protein/tetratricopeptide (TPR) repeat protein